MSQVPLRIVTFGADPNIAQRVCNRLRTRSIDAESYVIADTPAADTDIARIISSKKWDGVMIGRAVQSQPEWYDRVVKIVGNTSPALAIIQHAGPDELESALERHFKIQLPPAST